MQPTLVKRVARPESRLIFSPKIIRVEERREERIYLAFPYFFLLSPFLCLNESSTSEFFRQLARSRSPSLPLSLVVFVERLDHVHSNVNSFRRVAYVHERNNEVREQEPSSMTRRCRALMHRGRGRNVRGEKKNYKVVSPTLLPLTAAVGCSYTRMILSSIYDN